MSQVSQLCRGLLQPDPSQRHEASDGQSIVSWFVSRLEPADRRDTNGSVAAASDGAVTSRVGPVDIATASLPLGGTRAFEECGRDMMLPGDDARQGKWEGGVCPERADLSLDTAARRGSSEEERLLEAPDELVRRVVGWPKEFHSKRTSGSLAGALSGGGASLWLQRVPEYAMVQTMSFIIVAHFRGGPTCYTNRLDLDLTPCFVLAMPSIARFYLLPQIRSDFSYARFLRERCAR